MIGTEIIGDNLVGPCRGDYGVKMISNSSYEVLDQHFFEWLVGPLTVKLKYPVFMKDKARIVQGSLPNRG